MNEFIKSIPQLFYSQPFYANLILRGKGIGWRFILLQAALYFIFSMAVTFWGQSLSAYQKNIDNVFAQIPGVTIKDNRLSIDRPSPVTVAIPDKQGKSTNVVFDTNDRARDDAKIIEEMTSKNISMLLTKDFVASLSTQKNGKTVLNYETYAKYDDLSVTHDDFVMIGKNLVSLMAMASLGVSFVLACLGALLKAVFVKLFSLFFSMKLDFSAAMRLAAAASIPVGVLKILLVPFHLPISATVGLLISLTFACFGLISADRETKQAKS